MTGHLAATRARRAVIGVLTRWRPRVAAASRARPAAAGALVACLLASVTYLRALPDPAGSADRHRCRTGPAAHRE